MTELDLTPADVWKKTHGKAIFMFSIHQVTLDWREEDKTALVAWIWSPIFVLVDCKEVQYMGFVRMEPASAAPSQLGAIPLPWSEI